MSTKGLQHEINRLWATKPLKKSHYFQLSFFASEDGGYYYSMTSRWVGFTKDTPRREIREASLINPEPLIGLFKSIREPVFVINTKKDLQLFIGLIGRHCIVTKSLAKKYLSHLLTPQTFTYSFDNGFVSIDSMPDEKLKRYAAPKLRMKILNRDRRRCKICGASPERNEHVELHLHHIISYSSGGITDENNLITLCHTCHKGLEPHTDYSLFGLIGVGINSSRLNEKPYLKRIELNIKINLLRASR